jgi:transposase
MAQAIRKQDGKARSVQAGSGGTTELGVIDAHAAGIDIGATEEWVACPPKDGKSNVRKFGTDTPSLGELADWLASEGVVSVAMESTGVYWIPIFELLEARGFRVILTDSRTLGRVPGRKTDMLDCQWLQQLHAHGLLRGCFRPKDATLAFRSLLRTLRTLKAQQDDWIRRMQKALDQMNVRVHRAVSDITGLTGMRMVRAIVHGERDPAKLVALRDPRCRKSVAQIERELTGNWREEHLFNLGMALESYDHFGRQIEATLQRILIELEAIRKQREVTGLSVTPPGEVKEHSNPAKACSMERYGHEPLRAALAATFGVDLTAIEGVGAETAASILGEIGPEIQEAFPDAKPFVAYLRLAPNLAISGGKPVKGKKKMRQGSPVVHRLLRTSAASVRRSKSALGAYYRKTAFRKGAGTAVFATARKIAQHVYRALAHGIPYVTMGIEEQDRQAAERQRFNIERQAAKLGLKLVPAA